MAAKKTVAQKIIGDPELDAIAASIEKQFSKKGLISLGPSRERVTPIPTGSLNLDIGLGIGGIPRGRIIEIFGPESSGKTSLAILMASVYEQVKHQWGAEDKWVLVDDVEHTITIDLLEGIGLDPNRIIFARPDTGEEALQIMMDMTKSGRIGMAILDSIDAIQTEAQLKKKMGENEMGGASKILNRFMREYSKICDNTQTTAIFINQLKYNPGAMFGSPEVTPGGTGVKFYSSIRLKTMPGKPSAALKDAFTMRVKTIKNKVAPPRQDPISFEFLYAKGPDPYFDVITTAKELNIAYFGGANFMVRWPGADAAANLCKGGMVGARQFLLNNPEIYRDLRNACLTVAGVPGVTLDGTVEVEIQDDSTAELDETSND